MTARILNSAVAVLAASIASQAAAEMDGRTLVDICIDGDALQLGYCVGYMAGYREAKDSPWQAMRNPQGSLGEPVENGEGFPDLSRAGICVFPKLPNHQMREIVVNYIMDHPEVWEESAGSAISKSLWSAFPCEENM